MGKHESTGLECITEGNPLGGVDQPSRRAKHGDLLASLENLTYMVEAGLARMGLTHNEARIYVFLAKTGAKKASEIAKLLNLPRTETYNLLGSLQKKGLVSCTIHHPIGFVAVPFGNALNALVGVEKDILLSFERQSKELLDLWSSIAHHELRYEEIKEERFQILEGNNSVYRSIRDLVSSAQKEVIVMADQKQLIRLYHNEITDHFHSLTAKGVGVKILTFQPRPEILKELKRCDLRMLAQTNTNLHYIVVDKTQLLFFVKDNSDGNAPSAIWTNCESLVRCLLLLSEQLWNHLDLR